LAITGTLALLATSLGSSYPFSSVGRFGLEARVQIGRSSGLAACRGKNQHLGRLDGTTAYLSVDRYFLLPKKVPAWRRMVGFGGGARTRDILRQMTKVVFPSKFRFGNRLDWCGQGVLWSSRKDHEQALPDRGHCPPGRMIVVSGNRPGRGREAIWTSRIPHDGVRNCLIIRE